MVMWTDSQKKAIDARNNNLLIAAAAGSGKTAVLVERIIQIILKDRVDIDRLLIVTFTNAAAGEMRERIGSAILKELEKEDENEQHLRRQINLLNKASISTLHSFCISVVRKYFHLLEVDPNFRIGDETENSIMKLEALEEMFEAEYEKNEEQFIGLVERFGGKKDDLSLQQLVLDLFEFIQSKPYPTQWLKDTIDEFQININQLQDGPWYNAIVEQINIELSGAEEVFKEAIRTCQLPNGPSGYYDAIIVDIKLINDLKVNLGSGLTNFYELINNIKHTRLGKLEKDVNEQLKEQAKAYREQGKKIIKSIQENILQNSPEEFVKELNLLYPYMNYLYKLVNDFSILYSEKKLDKGIVDFNDLEHFALSILKNEQVSKEYKDKYQYIYVDEYQDSNIVQETILSFIKKENNLFMVGDVKQSIYRFRLADPSLFIEKYERYSNESEVLNRKIDLSKNFRSREEIINGVNYIFKNIMTKQFGEIDYDEKAFLYKGADTKPIDDPSIELHLVEQDVELTNIEVELEEELENIEKIEVEARITANRIKELLESKIYDSTLEQYRKVTYKDIVILLRTTKNWADSFMEVLTAEGIPTYADVNAGFFASIEISIFLDLLKLIDNKRQDIPLLSVLRSPIGGFSIEELIKIRTSSQARTYFEAMEDYVLTENDQIKDKLTSFLDKVQTWNMLSKYLQMDEFIWQLLIDTGYYYYVGAMPDGIQRQANLRILIDRASKFQDTSIKGLFNFIKFIDKLKNSSGDMGTAKILGENDNVIRIMSIHKSKGLEFPIVITAGMGKQFNLKDTNDPVLFHKDLGIGPQYIEPELRRYSDTIARVAMKNRIKLESLSEEMRILYVAFTRAKDKLILIGSLKNLQKNVEKWQKAISPFTLSKGKNYIDWIAPVLLRHQDGKIIREWSNTDWDENNLVKDDSKWTIKKWSKADIQMEELSKISVKTEFLQHLQNIEQEDATDEFNSIDQKLSWNYDNQIASKIPSKLAVTEIKKILNKELDGMGINIPALVKKPKFIEEKKELSAAEKGTVIHFIMQHLDFKRVYSREEIKEQIEEMIVAELISEQEALIVDIDKILIFFSSKIGQRILQTEKVFREVPFNFVKKVNEIIFDIEALDENFIIQGVIDLYFEEKDEFVLVDYKTDYVPFNNKEEIVSRYQTQINLYKEALEKITGKRVKESYLYLFHLNEEVKM